MKNTDNFSISKDRLSDLSFIDSGRLPNLPFIRIKNEVLGEKFELSLVFVGSAKSQALNREYRKKDKPTNILTFPLSESEGEIFICPEIAKHDAQKFEMKENDFIAYLFIHGLLHLNGLKHGEKMKKEEEKLMKKFKI